MRFNSNLYFETTQQINNNATIAFWYYADNTNTLKLQTQSFEGILLNLGWEFPLDVFSYTIYLSNVYVHNLNSSAFTMTIGYASVSQRRYNITLQTDRWNHIVFGIENRFLRYVIVNGVTLNSNVNLDVLVNIATTTSQRNFMIGHGHKTRNQPLYDYNIISSSRIHNLAFWDNYVNYSTMQTYNLYNNGQTKNLTSLGTLPTAYYLFSDNNYIRDPNNTGNYNIQNLITTNTGRLLYTRLLKYPVETYLKDVYYPLNNNYFFTNTYVIESIELNKILLYSGTASVTYVTVGDSGTYANGSKFAIYFKLRTNNASFPGSFTFTVTS